MTEKCLHQIYDRKILIVNIWEKHFFKKYNPKYPQNYLPALGGDILEYLG